MIDEIISRVTGKSYIKVSLYKDYQIATGYSRAQLRDKYAMVWKDKSFPKNQWQVVAPQLSDPLKLRHIQDTVDLIKITKLQRPKVLEVGCSSGYHAEIFKKVGLKLSYSGCDYSPSFIAMAKQRYPKLPFIVSDATRLKYSNKEFDIVLSGSCILHVVDYEKAISEAARVAKKFVIFTRTPIFATTGTTFVTKHAYGREMLEILFGEHELFNLFYRNNLAVVSLKTMGQFWVRGIDEPVSIKSYLCKKLNN